MSLIKETYHAQIEAGQREAQIPQPAAHKIGWLNLPGYKGETWNPVVGCRKVSEGCRNCYAERMANRLAGIANKKSAATTSLLKYADVIYNGKWNGKASFNTDELLAPLQWKSPRVVFVCSMGDLFHENTMETWIDKVMVMIALNPKHIFIILTKRAKRMAEYFSRPKEKIVEAWEKACYDIGLSDSNDDIDSPACFIYNRAFGYTKKSTTGWPLTNMWLGVTAENKAAANERIPALLKIKAAVKFVSVEPMLGPVNLSIWFYSGFMEPPFDDCVDWVICGGESGPGARPMHPDWVRSLRDQCKEAQVPFFFKQWGEWQNGSCFKEKVKHLFMLDDGQAFGYSIETGMVEIKNVSSEYWNKHTPVTVSKVGRKQSGNLLDGVRYETYPSIETRNS